MKEKGIAIYKMAIAIATVHEVFMQTLALALR